MSNDTLPLTAHVQEPCTSRCISLLRDGGVMTHSGHLYTLGGLRLRELARSIFVVVFRNIDLQGDQATGTAVARTEAQCGAHARGRLGGEGARAPRRCECGPVRPVRAHGQGPRCAPPTRGRRHALF